MKFKHVVVSVMFLMLSGLFVSCTCKHEWKPATCTEPQTCTKCGATEGSPFGHKYGDEKIVKNPTCIDDGVARSICSICNDVKEISIPATGHSFLDPYVEKKPTCVEPGIRRRFCKYCSVYEDSPIPATGHALGDAQVVKEASCTENGLCKKVCSVCNETVVIEIPMVAHTYGDAIFLQGKKQVQSCTVCGKTQISDKAEKKAGQFYTIGILDDFNEITGEYFYYAEGFNGTYSNSVVSDSPLNWNLRLYTDGSAVFTIYEDGKNRKISAAIYKSDRFDVKIREENGNIVKVNGKINQSEDFVYNEIFVSTSLRDVLARNNSVRIFISNDNGKYALGTMDTKQLKPLFFDVALVEKINVCLEARKYNEIKKLISTADKATYDFYNLNTISEKCDAYYFQDELQKAKTLYESQHYVEAINILQALSDGYWSYYKKSEASTLKEKCEKAEFDAKLANTETLYREQKYDEAIDVLLDLYKNYQEYYDSSTAPALCIKIREGYFEVKLQEAKTLLAENKNSEAISLLNFLSTNFNQYYRNSDAAEVMIQCFRTWKGPAGGYIFYDCDADNENGNADGLISTECGWRYLEAAPSDIKIGKQTKFIFGFYRKGKDYDNLLVNGTTNFNKIDCTNQGVGSGKRNTELLVATMGNVAYTGYSGTGTTTNYAAKLCDDYSYGGYDDWFLPSIGELTLMYNNLYRNGVGSFDNRYYWSSSENSSVSAWIQDFDYFGNVNSSRYWDSCVRAVRAF